MSAFASTLKYTIQPSDKSMNKLYVLPFSLLCIFSSLSDAQQPAVEIFNDLKPAMISQSVAILNVDLEKFKPDSLFELFIDDENEFDAKQLRKISSNYEDAFDALQKAGAIDLTLVLRLGTILPENRLVALRCESPQSANDVEGLLNNQLRGLFGLFPSVKAKGNVVFVSKSNSGRPNWAEQAAEQPPYLVLHDEEYLAMLQSLLERNESMPVRFAMRFSKAQIRALTELDPDTFISGENNEAGIRNLNSITFGMDLESKIFQLSVETDDAISMLAIGNGIATGMQKIANIDSLKKNLPEFSKWLAALPGVSSVEQNRMTIELVSDRFDNAAAAIAAPVNQFLRQSRFSKSVSKLRKIVLAMHNYHDAYGTMPPAYSVDEEGKPLLSWRVLILPFLDQNSLYKEFNLKEPWDSEANRLATSTIPAVYEDGLENKTRMQVVTGAETFDTEGVNLLKVTDGTSNTVAIVETDSEHAVIWSKPDDRSIDEMNLLQNLVEEGENGFWAAFCDASLHFMPADMGEKQFMNSLRANDGNIVERPSTNFDLLQYNPMDELPEFWFYRLVPQLWGVSGL